MNMFVYLLSKEKRENQKKDDEYFREGFLKELSSIKNCIDKRNQAEAAISQEMRITGADYNNNREWNETYKLPKICSVTLKIDYPEEYTDYGAAILRNAYTEEELKHCPDYKFNTCCGKTDCPYFQKNADYHLAGKELETAKKSKEEFLKITKSISMRQYKKVLKLERNN